MAMLGPLTGGFAKVERCAGARRPGGTWPSQLAPPKKSVAKIPLGGRSGFQKHRAIAAGMRVCIPSTPAAGRRRGPRKKNGALAAGGRQAGVQGGSPGTEQTVACAWLELGAEVPRTFQLETCTKARPAFSSSHPCNDRPSQPPPSQCQDTLAMPLCCLVPAQ